jgi:hypothetical protein
MLGLARAGTSVTVFTFISGDSRRSDLPIIHLKSRAVPATISFILSVLLVIAIVSQVTRDHTNRAGRALYNEQSCARGWGAALA